jgi:type I restriction enzyme R subunit
MEKDLEKILIEQLTNQEYEHVNILGQEDLKNNLKKQIEINNFINFEDDEFDRLYKQLIDVDGIFNASKIIRDRLLFERNDTTKINLLLYNTTQWCKNTFQIANQITMPHGNTYKKYDVTILINGFPMVQIELKNTNVAIKTAFNQIVQDYQPSYRDTLFKYLQLFIISNGNTTKYFVNNKNITDLALFTYADEENKPINSLSNFAETFLNKCFLSKIIARYIVLLEEVKELRVLRPYQMYAVEKIVYQVENSNSNGYIWHTTGSGKTLTSFKASTILRNNPNIAKILFVVDRKDLDYQTINEFNKFQENCVDLTKNTDGLIVKLQSKLDSNKLIVTTIQKLNNALSENRSDNFKNLADEKVVFIFDECHRSTFGDSFKKITKFFKKAQCFGFTGTPIMQSNASSSIVDASGIGEYQTTQSIFNKELHRYTIANAIADHSVLEFHLSPYKSLQELSKETIVDHIYKKHNSITEDRKFNAIFATNSIIDAIEYYKIFKQNNEDKDYLYKNDLQPLKVVAIFSPPQHPSKESSEDANKVQLQQKSQNIELQDLEAEKDTPDKIKEEGLKEIQKDYNDLYKLNINNYMDFYNNLSKRFKKYGEYTKLKQSTETIDILIVVDMFLTGYDSPFTNTLYVDKKLKQHGLIQAFSRTNRLAKEKYFAKILTFIDLDAEIEEAVVMYSAKTDDATHNPFLTKTFDKAKQDLTNALNTFKQGFTQQNLSFSADQWHNVKSNELQESLRADFSKLFKEYNFIKSYDLKEEQVQELNSIISKETLNTFVGVYKDLLSTYNNNKAVEQISEQTDETISQDTKEAQDTLNIEDIERYFESYVIDYDYIVKLLYKYGKQIFSTELRAENLLITKEDVAKANITKESIERLIKQSSYLSHQKDLLIEHMDEIIKNIANQNEEEFKQYVKDFLVKKQDEILQNIIVKHNANNELINKFIAKYLSVNTIDYDMLSNSLPQNMGLIARSKAQKQLKEDLFNNYIYLIQPTE